MSNWKRRIATPLLFLASLVGSLVLAELVLVVADLPPSHRAAEKDKHLEIAEPESLRRRVGWTNARSGKKTFRYDGDPRGYFGPGASVTHTTNSLGFRGPEFSRTKAEGALRVATLGDSFTFGEGIHDADTWSAQLQRRLAQAFPDRAVEVQNWGVGGYNTVQSAALFDALVLDFEPDIVVLGFTINDAEARLLRVDPNDGRILRRAPGMEVLTREPRGWERLRLVGFVRMGARNREMTDRVIAHHRALYADRSAGWRECRAAIRRIGDTCRGLGLGCYAVAFPLLWELPEYPLAGVQEKVVDELRVAGFDTLDLLPELAGYAGTDLWVHPTDQHPNEVVHTLAAELLAERIRVSLQPDTAMSEARGKE
jgi:hypothetical protein